MIRTTAACLIALAGIATAESVTVTVQPGSSSINVNATLATPVGTDSDTGSSSISGEFVIELDDYGTPTAITVHDFVLVLDDDVMLNFDYGFLGDANATLTGATAVYAEPGTPLGPVAIVSDAFSFADVPTQLGGAADYDYDFFLVGAGSDTFDLSATDVFTAPIDGTVTTDENFVYVNGDLVIDVVAPLLDGLATLTLTGTATINALGDAPAPGGCNAADVEAPFGILDLADIQTFVDAFILMTPAGDVNGDGIYDLTDIQTFVAAFLGGCP